MKGWLGGTNDFNNVVCVSSGGKHANQGVIVADGLNVEDIE